MRAIRWIVGAILLVAPPAALLAFGIDESIGVAGEIRDFLKSLGVAVEWGSLLVGLVALFGVPFTASEFWKKRRDDRVRTFIDARREFSNSRELTSIAIYIDSLDNAQNPLRDLLETLARGDGSSIEARLPLPAAMLDFMRVDELHLTQDQLESLHLGQRQELVGDLTRTQLAALQLSQNQLDVRALTRGPIQLRRYDGALTRRQMNLNRKLDRYVTYMCDMCFMYRRGWIGRSEFESGPWGYYVMACTDPRKEALRAYIAHPDYAWQVLLTTGDDLRRKHPKSSPRS